MRNRLGGLSEWATVLCLLAFALCVSAADRPPQGTSAGRSGDHSTKRKPHLLMMAPMLRHLHSNADVQATIDRARRFGFNGLHIPGHMDWFDFAAKRIDQVTGSLNEAAFRRVENVRAHMEREGMHVHVWIWGDHQNRLHPAVKFGERSKPERAVYGRLAECFGGKPNISFGVGFDLEEWMTVEEANWVMSQLPGLQVSMRHPTGAFDDTASIPSRMHRRPTEADFAELARSYSDASFLFSEDRFRNRPFEPENSGHIPLDYQLRIAKWARLYGVSCIFGNISRPQYRYEYGSMDYPEGWRILPQPVSGSVGRTGEQRNEKGKK